MQYLYLHIFHLALPQRKTFPIKLLDLDFWIACHFFSHEKSIPHISHCKKAYHSPEPNPWSQRHPPEANKTLIPNVDFNLVQYFTENKFSIKEQKIYNGKYKHYNEIFPLETQIEKTIYSIFIHSDTLFTIQYTYRI